MRYYALGGGGVLAVKPSRVLKAIRFNRIRMLTMAVGFSVVAMVSEGLPTLTAESLPVALISGFVGIFLDDIFFICRAPPNLTAAD